MRIKSLFLAMALASGAMASEIPAQMPVSIQAPDTFYHRPPVEKRCFSSKAVEKQIKDMHKKLVEVSPKLWQMFQNSFPNTLDTTVFPDGDRTFVITGDIDAMWLRDSGAQVWTYIQYIKNDPELQQLIKGVILQQFHQIFSGSGILHNVIPLRNGHIILSAFPRKAGQQPEHRFQIVVFADLRDHLAKLFPFVGARQRYQTAHG